MERLLSSNMRAIMHASAGSLGIVKSPPRRQIPAGAAWTRGSQVKRPKDDGPPTVFVIDDDREIRESIQGLLKSVGLRTELFGSVQEFLDGGSRDVPGCLVLDIRLPGRSGL